MKSAREILDIINHAHGSEAHHKFSSFRQLSRSDGWSYRIGGSIRMLLDTRHHWQLTDRQKARPIFSSVEVRGQPGN